MTEHTEHTDEPDDVDDSDRMTTESSGRERQPTASGAAAEQAGGAADGRRSRDIVRYVNYLVLIGLVLLALVAGIQFYGAVSRTINQWVTAEYRSLFHGAFNLAVLLIAAAGISWQIRRVTS
ncbi:hypothetical protein ACFQFH_18425 [Halobaculum halobium]|uniref:DUF8060 domain-containing protein n=1 Tax=Halobaculum halobium TaxID=3032281 RepID=A0ABD5TEA0_9EURY|nr:hypothetical protein [Halobaculum sp. SYNS20]